MGGYALKGPFIVEIRNLHVSYPDDRIALDDISLDIEAGESVAIIGANGAGKTTLLQALVGLVPVSGKVKIGGLEVNRANLSEIRRIAQLAFQDPDDQLFMPTVLEDVAFGPLNFGKSREEARWLAEYWLKAVGLDDYGDRSPDRMSLGERKRAALAAVMACEPKLLLLDEPTAGLDPRSQTVLLDILQKLHEDGLTLITATHDLLLLPHLADRAVVLSEDHRVVADAPAELILSNAELLLSVNLIHEHCHRHGILVHRHPHEHIIAHEHVHED